jgi:hypothetical protein
MSWIIAEPRDRKEARGGILGESSLLAEFLVGVVKWQKGGHDNAVAMMAERGPVGY